MLLFFAALANQGDHVEHLGLRCPQRGGALHRGAVPLKATLRRGRVDALYGLKGELRLLFAPPPGTLAGFLPRSHLTATLASATFLSRRRRPLGRTIPGVNRRFSVRLSDELAQGIDALSQSSGKTKSEVVRDALTSVGLGNSQSTTSLAEALRRAATLRARQTKVFDVVALVREGREGLDQRGSRLRKPPLKDPACTGRREPPGGRVTPGFQR